MIDSWSVQRESKHSETGHDFPSGPRFSLLDHDFPYWTTILTSGYDYLAQTTVLPTEVPLGLKAEMIRS